MSIPLLTDFSSLTVFYILTALLITYTLLNQFRVPPQLAHLPKVPVLPLLLSYARGEPENQRIEKLILPFANKHGHGVVLVYALGRWMIHCVDTKIIKYILDDPLRFPKESPPDGILLWRLVGYSNIILVNGENWKLHSKIVREALNRRVPIEEFVELAKRVFGQMGDGSGVVFDDLAMRFALDAVGTTALGYNFNSIEDTHSPFITDYGHVMEAIANPFYLLMPRLERLLPRKGVIKKIDRMRERFDRLLEKKKEERGNDMFTFMLEEEGLSDAECRDNMVVFFIAGHDTSAGALSSLIYYLSLNTTLQSLVRTEVSSILSSLPSHEPTLSSLSPQNMPLLNACIREALRLNTPVTYIVPRSAKEALTLRGEGGKTYEVPEGASLVMNLTAVHHTEEYFRDADVFKPERWLENGEQKADEHENTWLPFATGPRQCPARNFALYELRTLSAMLLHKWKWTLPEGSVHEKEIQNAVSPFALSLPKRLVVDFERVEQDSEGM